VDCPLKTAPIHANIDELMEKIAGGGATWIEYWLIRGRHDCVCCRVKWRDFCTAGACCVEDGCVLSCQRGVGLHYECVFCGGREESVGCHINWLGSEVSVYSDRLGVLGVLRRLLCEGREESVC